MSISAKTKFGSITILCIASIILFGNVSHAQNRTIVLAHETSWAPQYGKELPGGGYTVAIVREALKRAGYNLEIAWLPWVRALEEAAAGKYDGIGASYFNAERDKKFAYTDSFAKTETVFFKLKNKDIEYDKLVDLAPYIIGTTLGYGYPIKFQEADYLNKDAARLPVHNIRKLLRGRIDLVISSRKVLLNLLQQNFPDDLHRIDTVTKAVGTQELFVAFSRNTEGYVQKVSDFNNGLNSMIEDGTINKILEDYGFL